MIRAHFTVQISIQHKKYSLNIAFYIFKFSFICLMVCHLKYVDSEQFIIILTFLMIAGGRYNIVLGLATMGKCPAPQRYVFWSYSLS